MASTATQDALTRMAREDAPVLEAVLMMHADTLVNCSLDERSYHLVRLAALVAMEAPPASYLVNLPAAADAGVTLEDAQGVLVAVAPIIGTARITAAAGNVLRAFGLAAELTE